MARKRQRAKDRKQKLHRENVPGSLDHASAEVDQVEAAIVAGAGGEPVEPAPEGVADEPVDAVQADDEPDPEPDVVEPDPVDAESEPVDVEPVDVEPEPLDVEPEPVAAAEPAPRRRRGRRKPAAEPEPVEALEPIEDVGVVDDAEPVTAFDDEFDDEFDDAPASDNADAATVERGRLGQGAGDVAVTPNAQQPAGFRLTNFIRASWAELQRVQWPDRRQVGQATAVVLGFVVVAGAFLGLADVIAQRIVDLII